MTTCSNQKPCHDTKGINNVNKSKASDLFNEELIEQ